jgi:hypothetical protein
MRYTLLDARLLFDVSHEHPSRQLHLRVSQDLIAVLTG